MKCRKLLAILLALVMVIGLLPFAALAEELSLTRMILCRMEIHSGRILRVNPRTSPCRREIHSGSSRLRCHCSIMSTTPVQRP